MHQEPQERASYTHTQTHTYIFLPLCFSIRRPQQVSHPLILANKWQCDERLTTTSPLIFTAAPTCSNNCISNQYHSVLAIMTSTPKVRESILMAENLSCSIVAQISTHTNRFFFSNINSFERHSGKNMWTEVSKRSLCTCKCTVNNGRLSQFCLFKTSTFSGGCRCGQSAGLYGKNGGCVGLARSPPCVCVPSGFLPQSRHRLVIRLIRHWN